MAAPLMESPSLPAPNKPTLGSFLALSRTPPTPEPPPLPVPQPTAPGHPTTFVQQVTSVPPQIGTGNPTRAYVRASTASYTTSGVISMPAIPEAGAGYGGVAAQSTATAEAAPAAGAGWEGRGSQIQRPLWGPLRNTLRHGGSSRKSTGVPDIIVPPRQAQKTNPTGAGSPATGPTPPQKHSTHSHWHTRNHNHNRNPTGVPDIVVPPRRTHGPVPSCATAPASDASVEDIIAAINLQKQQQEQWQWTPSVPGTAPPAETAPTSKVGATGGPGRGTETGAGIGAAEAPGDTGMDAGAGAGAAVKAETEAAAEAELEAGAGAGGLHLARAASHHSHLRQSGLVASEMGWGGKWAPPQPGTPQAYQGTGGAQAPGVSGVPGLSPGIGSQAAGGQYGAKSQGKGGKLRLSLRHGAPPEALSAYVAAVGEALEQRLVARAAAKAAAASLWDATSAGAASALAAHPKWTPATADVNECYWFLEELGRGHVGVIRLCQDRETRQSFACKTVHKAAIRKVEDVKELCAEAQSLLKIQQKFGRADGIVAIKEVLEDRQAVHFVLEYCPGGDLFSYVASQGSLSERDTALIMRQLIDSLSQIHACDIIHRDLKLENILLASSKASKKVKPRVKIADFGLSVELPEGGQVQGAAGSPFYMAPEVFSQSAYGKEADIWCLGVILYACLAGYLPFEGKSHSDIYSDVMKADPPFSKRPWGSVSSDAKSLIRAMLNPDPTARIPLADILAHPWMLRFCPELRRPGAGAGATPRSGPVSMWSEFLRRRMAG